MLASEVITRLGRMISVHGDKQVNVVTGDVNGAWSDVTYSDVVQVGIDAPDGSFIEIVADNVKGR